MFELRLTGSFLGLAIGQDIEERETTSLESSPTIQITWLWTLNGHLHFVDGSTGYVCVFVEYQTLVVCFL